MEELVRPDRLRDRILLKVEEEVRADALPKKAVRILEAILYRGELLGPSCSIYTCRTRRGCFI